MAMRAPATAPVVVAGAAVRLLTAAVAPVVVLVSAPMFDAPSDIVAFPLAAGPLIGRFIADIVSRRTCAVSSPLRHAPMSRSRSRPGAAGSLCSAP